MNYKQNKLSVARFDHFLSFKSSGRVQSMQNAIVKQTSELVTLTMSMVELGRCLKFHSVDCMIKSQIFSLFIIDEGAHISYNFSD